LSQISTKKEQLLEVAQRLFMEHGYAGTSVRDIAREMNIEPASLYSHIKTKEDLLEATCFDLAEKFLQTASEVNDIYFNAEQKLRMAVKMHVEILTNNLPASVVFMRDWRNLSPDLKASFISKRNAYEAGIREIVQTGIDEGLFNETDLQFASLTILSSVNWITEWYKAEGELTAEEIANKLSDFILTGLKKPSIQ
jgi:AcrR family transcriptional regulator